MELVLFTRLLVGVVLAISAVFKWRHPRGSVRSIIASESLAYLPRRFRTPATSALLAVEPLLAAALIVGWRSREALLSAGLLFAGFAATNARVLLSQQHKVWDCGCLGERVSLHPGWALTVMNGSLSIATIAAALSTAVRVGPPVTSPPHALVPLGAVACLGALTYWTLAYGLSVAHTVTAALQSPQPHREAA